MVTEEQQWYVQKGAHVQGPFTTNEVGRYLLLGRVRNTDRVSKDGELWEPVTQVPELIPEELLNLDSELGWKKYLQSHQDNEERLVQVDTLPAVTEERRHTTEQQLHATMQRDWVGHTPRLRAVSLLPLCLLGLTLAVLLLVIYIHSTSTLF